MSLKNIGKIISQVNDLQKFKTWTDAAENAADTISDLAENIKKTPDAAKYVSSLKFGDEILDMAGVADDIADVADTAIDAGGKLAGFKNAIVGVFSGIRSAIAANPIVASIAAISMAFIGLSLSVEDAKEKIAKAQNSAAKYTQTTGEIDSLQSQLETIGGQIDTLNAKEHLSFTDKSELSNLQAQSAELERQISLKEQLAKNQHNQAARDAAKAQKAFSWRDSTDTNKEGFFRNILDGLYSGGSWIYDKLGVGNDPTDLFNPGMDAVDIFLKRIDSAKQAQEKLKQLQDSQTVENYDAVQKQIDKQQKVIDNYSSDINDLYEQMSSYSNSFFDDKTGNPLSGFETEAKRYKEAQQAYLDFFNVETSGQKLDKTIKGVLDKVQFSSLKDKLIEVGKEGYTDLSKVIESGDYNEIINTLVDSLDTTKDKAKQKLQDYIMSISDPNALKLDEIKKQLSDTFLSAIDDDDAYQKLGSKLNSAEQFWKDWINDMSDEDLEILYSIKQDNDTSTWELEDWKKAFEEVKTSAEDTSSTISKVLESAKTNISNMQTAMQNANSSTGMTTDDIKNINSAFSDLIDNGYATNDMVNSAIVRTSAGLQIDRDRLSQLNTLEEQYTRNNFVKAINERAEALRNYKIENANIAGTDEYNLQVQSLTSQLSNVRNLASEYDGLTSAYNKWIQAQNNGEDGDRYSNISSAKTNIDEEYKAGKIGTEKFKTYVDYMWQGDARAFSPQDIQNVYDELSPLLSNFFVQATEKNGLTALEAEQKSIANVVSAVQNDLDGALQKYASRSPISQIDEETKKATLDVRDFGDAWGLSAEAVYDIAGMFKDWGWDVEITGMDTNTANVEEMADAFHNAQKALQDMNVDEANMFNWDTVDMNSLNEQITTASNMLQEFKNEDGTLNLKAEGAQETYTILETLLRKKEDLQHDNNILLKVQTDDSTLQSIQTFMSKKNQLDTQTGLRETLGIEIDTSKLESEVQAALDDVKAKVESSDISPEIKAKLDFSNANTLEESIKNLSKDEQMEIAAALDIDTTALDDAENRLSSIGNNSYNITLNVSGNETIEQAHDALATLPPNSFSNVTLNVTGAEQVNSVSQELDQIPKDSSVNLTFNVSNVEEADVLTSKIEELNSKRDGDNQITYTMNIVAGEDATSNILNNIESNKSVSVNVQVAGQEQITALQGAISNIQSKPISVDVTTNGFPELTMLKTAIDAVQAKTIDVMANVSGTVETNLLVAAINRVVDKLVSITAIVNGLGSVQSLASAIANVKNKTVYVTSITNNVSSAQNKRGTGGSPKASGTMFSPAYADGTVYNVINTKPISAYSSGKVTLPHDERALVNEEYINGHSESIVRDGKWFLIPGGAHFENLKRGDLIFNAKQTDELLKYGMTNSHARTYASGTVSNVRNLAATSLSVAYASGSDTDNSFDWIEIWIKRFEEEIDHLTSAMTDIVGNSWKEQNKYIDRMLKLNNEAIKKNREAVNVYMQKANAVGLSDAYKTAVQKGQIKVEDISDENLRKKIEEYQSYYEKRLELDRKYDELVVKNLEYALTRMENIMDDYDKSISKQDSYISMLSAKNDYDEALGKKPNVSNYNGMLATYNETISSLTEEYKLVQEEFNRLVKAGTIKAGTDEYNEWTEKLNGMQEALYNARTEAAKLAEELRSIRWNNWNDNQNILEQAADEVQDVLSMIEDLRNYDDNGNITENGVTKLGLYSIQLENTKKQIAQYDTAIANLDKELKAGLITQDKYNEELADYKDKQRDAQKASKDARDAILDLVKEGINAAIDAYSELIDKRKEALQDDRSFRDHSRKIAEYEKELADIQNQINSYSASGSREDLAKVKELEKQKADIQKEYSEYMEDYQTDKQLEALDKELEDFKEKQEDKITELETSLDAQEVAIRSALETVTDDYTEVYGVLGSLADIYGEKLTETLSKPWQDAKSAYEQYMNAVKSIDEFSGSGTVTTDKYTVSKNSSGKTTIIDNATGQGKAGWTKIGNDWYYADSSGVAQGNQWVKSGGKWYHTDASGKMQTGWVKDKDKWYYLDESGAMVTGWKKVKNKWYYLNDDGSMATGWKKVGGEWYFMNDDGSMKSSEWVKYKDKWYYLQQGGAMAKNAYIKDEKKDLYYWVNKDGEWEPKWNTSTPDLKKYKLAYANGTMNSAPGWKWINEDGIELVRTASGDLLYTKGGDTVFTNPMTQNLAEFSKSPEAFIRDYLPKFELLNIPQKDIANNIIVESPQLIIQGNVDNSTLPKIEKMINEKINDFTKQLSNNTKLHGATSNANRIR